MKKELSKEIYQWVLSNEDSYRRECDGDHRYYLTEDAIDKFGSRDETEDAEEDRWEIGDIVYKALNRIELENK